MGERAEVTDELDAAPTVLVATGLLWSGDTPRLDGASEDHARALAESDEPLPAILVHRATMRVIDGTHRLRAAHLRGATEVEVRFFDGTEEEAFVLAVRSNVTHGLPLSLADRKAAAERILRSHPHWSNRATATVVGLSATTVAAIRGRRGETASTRRVGRDGRLRPIDGARGRRAAGAVLEENSNATLREISAAACISLNTARDVRDRIRRGEDPVLPGRTAFPSGAGERSRFPSTVEGVDWESVLTTLRRDPSLRFAEKGRLLLRLLDTHATATANWAELVDTVPAHWAGSVADLAAGCAQSWQEFAEELKSRTTRIS